MKLPIFLDPKRANDADVLQAYEAASAQMRGHANHRELDTLIARAAAIKSELGRTSAKKKARQRVLRAKLRHANHEIREWLQLNGMK